MYPEIEKRGGENTSSPRKPDSNSVKLEEVCLSSMSKRVSKKGRGKVCPRMPIRKGKVFSCGPQYEPAPSRGSNRNHLLMGVAERKEEKRTSNQRREQRGGTFKRERKKRDEEGKR